MLVKEEGSVCTCEQAQLNIVCVCVGNGLAGDNSCSRGLSDGFFSPSDTHTHTLMPCIRTASAPPITASQLLPLSRSKVPFILIHSLDLVVQTK